MLHGDGGVKGVGLVVWKAAPMLAEWLIARHDMALRRGARVLELGAGCGVLGIALAKVFFMPSRLCLLSVPRL